MTKMLAIAKRILLQFFYDKRTLLLLFAAPVIVLWLLSVLLGASGYIPKVAVQNLPEEYVTSLRKQDVQIVDVSKPEADSMLREGQLDAILELPEDSKTLEIHLEGSGYHDHNWGDVSMFKLMHHWYWGRAKIGDYKVISSWITAGAKYGFNEFDIFMLAKGPEILGDNSNHTLRFLPENEYTDENTGKPVYGRIIYEYETPVGEEYRITFDRKGDISREFFYQSLPKGLQPFAKLAGFLGSYQRFSGTVMVERLEEGSPVETVMDNSAVWELMYFGKAGADKK